MAHPGLESRTHGSSSQRIRPDWKGCGKRAGQEGSRRGSLSIEAAAAIDRGPSAIHLRHLVLLIQEVQRVVAWEATDGELVGHLGPVFTVGGHTLIQLCRLGEQVLQKSGGVGDGARLEVKNQQTARKNKESHHRQNFCRGLSCRISMGKQDGLPQLGAKNEMKGPLRQETAVHWLELGKDKLNTSVSSTAGPTRHHPLQTVPSHPHELTHL